MKSALLANLALTFTLVGLIWTIQVVHYPLFARVGAEAWARYHAEHTARITLIVGPLMLVEAAAAAWLVLASPPEARGWALAGAACVAVAWGDTFFRAVPLHGKLGAAPDLSLVAALVRVNLLRTVAWTVRGAILIRLTLRAWPEG